MSAVTVGLGTLRRLRALATDGHPVLSLYVDPGERAFQTPAGRDASLAALLASAGASDPVRELLRTRPELLRGGRGLAVIFSAPAGVFEAVVLPDRVEPMAVLDTIVWVEPLVAMVSCDDWGVLVLGRRVARLFRGGPRGLVEFAAIDATDSEHGAQNGCGPRPMSPGSDDQLTRVVRRANAWMLRAHRRRKFDRLVLVAADELCPVLDAALDGELRAHVTARVVLDMDRAGAREITQAVATAVEQAEQARERGLLERLSRALASGGPAAAGVDEVLASLEQRRIETVMVAEGAQLIARLCPRCGRLSGAGERHCPLDGAPLAPVDAVDHALEHAHRQRVTVLTLRHEAAGLRDHGSIAALLHA